MRRSWQLLNPDSQKIKIFTAELGISSQLAGMLLNRNITEIKEAEKFLSQSLYDLPDPYQLKDMSKAVERIKRAIQFKEKTMIVGDYDVDGVTSLALLYEFFTLNSIPILWYIPDRIEEGYGISEDSIKLARDEKINLFISLDCGITAFQEIEALKNAGIDVLIIDHHRPHGNNYPSAFAIIDPWQNDCRYPEKDLTSAGLVFKVLQALEGQYNEKLLQLLDLVCLATVADLASLKGENRVLVKYGFQALRETKRIGLKQLFNVTGLRPEDINARSISYVIAPRLNAGGRIDKASIAFLLLVTNSFNEAEELANKLDVLNKKRQEIENQILTEAYAIIEKEMNFKDEKVIIVYGQDWHPGVLGIVASKLTDRYFRPSIVLSESQGFLRGSGRSVPDFNIFDAISSCEQILEEFGGHSAACGMTLKKKNLAELKARLNNYAEEIFRIYPFTPRLDIDQEIDFSDVNSALIKDIEALSPFGAGNPEPLFLTKSAKVISEPKPISKKFYKFWLKKGRFSYLALYKDKNEHNLPLALDSVIDLVYLPSLEEWEGIKNITLFLEDFRESEE